MKKHLSLLATGMILLGWAGFAWAQCPEDTMDSGICDTFYVTYQNPENPIPPTEIYFTLQITHDVPDPVLDSIHTFSIPLKITHTNPAAYCSIPEWRNKKDFYPDTANSIFRHFRGMENRMMSMYEQGEGEEWSRYLHIDYDTAGAAYFRLDVVVMDPECQAWGEGSKTLLATITLLVEDTMTICVDSCFWPPMDHFYFWTPGALQGYVPRHFMPVCKWTGLGPPPTIICPPEEWRNTNGTFQTGNFSAWSEQGVICSVVCDFWGSGITDFEVVYTEPPPQPYVEGYVVFTVTDHCMGGGVIGLFADDCFLPSDYCYSEVALYNNPPVLSLPDSVLALTEHSLYLEAYASDTDSDSVGIVFDALWYESDSLQPPTNPPSYDGGNPGIFTWTPAEADTGIWIASFSAIDVCGRMSNHRVAILVQIPFEGDCNGDGAINLADVVYLVNYLFIGGPPPDPLEAGDANCDGEVDLADAVYIINYLFIGGPPPWC
jgi:hypothetical protein